METLAVTNAEVFAVGGGEEVLERLAVGEDEERESRAQATAWFAPLPPGSVWKEVAVRVSPAEGRRGVYVVRSMFREPIMRRVGRGMVMVGWRLLAEGCLLYLVSLEGGEGRRTDHQEGRYLVSHFRCGS